MADITETGLREFVLQKLPSESEIPAVDHRAVENKIIDYIVQETGKTIKSKLLYLDVFTTDRNYSVSTGLSTGVIDGVIVMLECKTSNNSFVEGDTVTAPTPYPTDSGRTAAQGIGAQFNKLDASSVKVLVNDQVTIMKAYRSAVNATADNLIISGGDTANWRIKLIVIYK